MKTIYKSLIAAVILAPLASCVEETFPTNIVTDDQLAGSATATEALVWGMSAYYNKVNCLNRPVDNELHFDFGYGAMMHIRDIFTDQFAVAYSGYDQFYYWEVDQYIGPDYAYPQFIYTYYTKSVLTANNIIGAINEEEANNQQLCFLGMGYANRASSYLDMARMFEFLPAPPADPITYRGKDVTYYTVPIITDKTTEEECRNNPRVKREDMFDFILSDLEKAEELIQKGARTSKTQPDLACVYGLYARLYMWVENYPKAAEYAKLAYTQHGGYSTITTEDQWLSKTSGFNTLETPSWMWGAQNMKEDDSVQSGILNWTSWSSNETTYGYTSYGPFNRISNVLYDKMNDTDFRKLSYLAPAGSPLYGKEPVISEDYIVAYKLPAYSSLKFRPGEGNQDDYNIGSATAYPLMRVEEMYLIEAEAVAHSNAGEGKALLEYFVQNFRDPNYVCTASDIVKEIYLQKGIELWGEGQIYYDLKRLGYPVTRDYEGTIFFNQAALNTPARAAWLNVVFPRNEVSNNVALDGWNNPDPSSLY